MNGLKITGAVPHFIERLEERNLNIEDTIDALKNPINIGNIKLDRNGKPSIEFVGKKHRIQVNPETGKLITGWKTSRRIRKKYLGEGYENNR